MYTNYAPTLTRTPGPERAHPLTSASISRLMAAAVINKRFRNLLLTSPQEALMADFALQLVTPREDKPQVPSGFWIPVDRQAVVLDAQ